MFTKIVVSLFFVFFSSFCCAGQPAIFVARGITVDEGYKAQENSLDAILAISKWNAEHTIQDQIKGCEVHVIVTQPNHKKENPSFVCSHDENVEEITGENVDIRYLTREQIEKLKIKKIINGMEYDKPRNFAFFEQILDGITQGTPSFKIWLGVKDKSYNPLSGKSYTAVEIIKALENWRNYYLKERNIDIFQYLIVSSTNPAIVDAMNKESKARGLHKQGLIIPSDYSDYGLPPLFWKIFLDQNGGFERLYGLTANWVCLQNTLINAERIKKYHDQNIKVLGYGFKSRKDAFAQEVDALLVWKVADQ
ncbi:MAG: glycerophosphodiester phosphodiesterase family protein [Gammaproteobacteria bacterium]